jgi:hypothetical protein
VVLPGTPEVRVSWPEPEPGPIANGPLHIRPESDLDALLDTLGDNDTGVQSVEEGDAGATGGFSEFPSCTSAERDLDRVAVSPPQNEPWDGTTDPTDASQPDQPLGGTQPEASDAKTPEVNSLLQVSPGTVPGGEQELSSGDLDTAKPNRAERVTAQRPARPEEGLTSESLLELDLRGVERPPRRNQAGEHSDRHGEPRQAEEQKGTPETSDSPMVSARHQPPSPLLPFTGKPGAAPAELSREPLAPEKRGGRPRGPIDQLRKAENRSWTPKPELLCFRQDREWHVALDLHEGAAPIENLQVLVGDQLAGSSYDENGIWVLEHFTSPIRVVVDGREVASWSTENLPFLLFKLNGDGWGRLVRSVSQGDYLIVVRSGSRVIPNSPEHTDVIREAVGIRGFEGWRCWIECAQTSIHVATSTQERLDIPSSEVHFRLEGREFADDIGNQGQLFLGAPPKVSVLADHGWSSVGTVVLVEERRGKKKWRTHFHPVESCSTQDLPSELAARGGGRYSARFYDHSDNLIESFDFRFSAALTDVVRPKLSPIPGEYGHTVAEFRFLHSPGLVLQPGRGDAVSRVAVRRVSERETVLAVPHEAAVDLTRWRIREGGGPWIDIALHIDRLWWAIAEELHEQKKWIDRPATLPREYFRAGSKATLYLLLPREGWSESTSAGFRGESLRLLHVPPQAVQLPVGLGEFCLSLLLTGTGSPEFVVCLRHEGRTEEFVAGRVPPDAMLPVLVETGIVPRDREGASVAPLAVSESEIGGDTAEPLPTQATQAGSPDAAAMEEPLPRRNPTTEFRVDPQYEQHKARYLVCRGCGSWHPLHPMPDRGLCPVCNSRLDPVNGFHAIVYWYCPDCGMRTAPLVYRDRMSCRCGTEMVFRWFSPNPESLKTGQFAWAKSRVRPQNNAPRLRPGVVESRRITTKPRPPAHGPLSVLVCRKCLIRFPLELKRKKKCPLCRGTLYTMTDDRSNLYWRCPTCSERAPLSHHGETAFCSCGATMVYGCADYRVHWVRSRESAELHPVSLKDYQRQWAHKQ